MQSVYSNIKICPRVLRKGLCSKQQIAIILTFESGVVPKRKTSFAECSFKSVGFAQDCRIPWRTLKYDGAEWTTMSSSTSRGENTKHNFGMLTFRAVLCDLGLKECNLWLYKFGLDFIYGFYFLYNLKYVVKSFVPDLIKYCYMLCNKNKCIFQNGQTLGTNEIL